MRRVIFSCTAAVVVALLTPAASLAVFQRLAPKSDGRGTIADHSLTIASGRNGAESRGEFADSLTGGPDYWEVTGLGANDTLNLREAPSPRAKRVANLPSGTMLKNLGCKIGHARRWCKVERPDDPSVRGWVNGRYLRESAGRK